MAGLSAGAGRSFGSGNTRRACRLVGQMGGGRSPRPGIGVRDGNGEMLCEADGVRGRWTECGTQLFGSGLPRHAPGGHPLEVLGPEVMPGEIRAAMGKLRDGGAAGLGGAFGEMVETGGTVVQAMRAIIDGIWRTGVWPSDWTRSEIVALPGVPGARGCSRRRAIGLLCRASGVLLGVVRGRLARFVIPPIAGGGAVWLR